MCQLQGSIFLLSPNSHRSQGSTQAVSVLQVLTPPLSFGHAPCDLSVWALLMFPLTEGDVGSHGAYFTFSSVYSRDGLEADMTFQ